MGRRYIVEVIEEKPKSGCATVIALLIVAVCLCFVNRSEDEGTSLQTQQEVVVDQEPNTQPTDSIKDANITTVNEINSANEVEVIETIVNTETSSVEEYSSAEQQEADRKALREAKRKAKREARREARQAAQ